MAYSHKVCLEQELLIEHIATVKGFIFRNKNYGSLAMTDELEKLQEELWSIEKNVFPNDSVEPLKKMWTRVSEIYEIFKEATPQPHV